MKIKSIICSFLIALLLTSSVFCALPIGSVSLARAEELPSSYCMRDEYIIFTQNQDRHGYCWNFAGTMAASTTLMKATGEYYDFSELWTGVALNNTETYYYKMGAGGSMSYQYEAMQKAGLMLECDLPYQYANISSTENSTDYYNFFERYSNDDLASCLVLDSTTKFKKSDVEGIKNHLLNHGSLYLSFSFRTGYVYTEFNGANTSYLPPNQKNPTSAHAVSLIGWDDDYTQTVTTDAGETKTFKGAWLLLNSYTETSGIDGLSFIFYEDENISGISGYKYQKDTTKDLYFYDKIESGYAYPNALKNKYHGDFKAEKSTTKQKNIFYNDVDLAYSYEISNGATIKDIEIYLNGQDVSDKFSIEVDKTNKRFYITKTNADYGQYKVIVTYGNDQKTDAYLNNFFVTHGLIGEDLELDYDPETTAFTRGHDLEYYSYTLPNKDYIIYTNTTSGELNFIQRVQSVYSEVDMNLPKITYDVTEGDSQTKTYTITAPTGYQLDYNFTFEYNADTTLQTVNVFYDLAGGVNNAQNHAVELASDTQDLKLYAPTRQGYTFKGWYLDYGNGSQKIKEIDGVYYVGWEDICHLGDAPNLNALSYYNKYYANSSTLFVYAKWEEIDYHKVSITIEGDGSTQIDKDLLIGQGERVRYLFKQVGGWAVAQITVNGVALEHDEFVEAVKYGLVVENVQEDVEIKAIFKEGVYLDLDLGENIKDAYIIGTYQNQTKEFRNGDFIPKEYFSKTNYLRPIISDVTKNDNVLIKKDNVDIKIDDIKRDDVNFNKDDIDIDIDDDDDNPFKTDDDIIVENSAIDGSLFGNGGGLGTLFPVIRGSEFVLIVEVYADTQTHTYVLDDVSSYTAVSKGVFTKSVYIGENDGLAQISIAPASLKPIEDVTVTYEIGAQGIFGNYVLDHYISADKNATTGTKNSGTFKAGQVVYLFVKKEADTVKYYHRLPDIFEEIGGGWYRAPIYVNADDAHLGTLTVTRELQKYTVTWKNWDGSVLYTETYSYGSTPKYYNKNAQVKDAPTRPSDNEHSYYFIGWDSTLSAVVGDVTYIAQYEPILRRYEITVELGSNGTVTPGVDNYMDILDKVTYTFIPDVGYKVKDVKVNGVSVGAVTSYTLENVQSNQLITVEFEKLKYVVNVICGDNGSVDKGGSNTVEYQDDLTINVTPCENYAIDYIRIDGVAVETTNALTLYMIEKDTLVEIGFKRVVCQITTTAQGKGEVTPSSSVNVGQNARIDFKAQLGYKVKDVVIDGVSVGAVTSYTLVNVDSDHTISVVYALDVSFVIAICFIGLLAVSVLAFMIVIFIKKRAIGRL